ncbi:GNAT family N-acetyltransferase [Gammaproteobacteria bacterium]|nr:GNAT family N-acetyltransferase [Gammaproteobacteria bacterium]
MDVYNHLSSCDTGFIPPLSSKVELRSYSKKLTSKAYRFEFWVNDELMALVAMYCDDHERKIAFITSVSVHESLRGQGIAKKLLINAIEYAANIQMASVKLELSADNEKAFNLYRNMKFQSISREDKVIMMELKIFGETCVGNERL